MSLTNAGDDSEAERLSKQPEGLSEALCGQVMSTSPDRFLDVFGACHKLSSTTASHQIIDTPGFSQVPYQEQANLHSSAKFQSSQSTSDAPHLHPTSTIQTSAPSTKTDAASPTFCAQDLLTAHLESHFSPPPDSARMQTQKRRPAGTAPTDEEERGAFAVYVTLLCRKQCAICGITLLPTKDAWLKWLKALDYSENGIICRMCNSRSKIAVESTFLIWAWLCSLEFDDLYGRGSTAGALICRSPITAYPNKPPANPGSSIPTKTKPSGTGYGGVDYHHNYVASHKPQPMPPSPFLPSTASRKRLRKIVSPKTVDLKPEEIMLARLFKALAVVIPTVSTLADTTFSIIMINRSLVLEYAATLLRTSNFESVTRLHDLYGALLEFLQHLADHRALSRFLFARVLFIPEARILELSLSSSDSDQSRAKAQFQTVQPLASLLKTFTTTAERMHTFSLDDLEAVDRERLLGICLKLGSLNNSMYALSKAGVTGEVKGKERAVETEAHRSTQDEYAQWHREICVEAIDDDLIQSHHYHCNHPPKAQNGVTPAKGRAKRLLTELVTLTSSLPEGIFVRHGSSRLDIMKVLIMGPVGTPYSRGLFEFDLFCPMDYPQRPPLMQFRTTGKGRAHFNPNLYQSGKVCLSLLGTWSGPSWVPHESTILQILVSIQAMILCEEPWYNEPGRENFESGEVAKNYNRTIHTLTIPYALTDWLRPLCPNSKLAADPVWSDVIRKHFVMFGNEICETIREWAEEAAKAKPLVRARKPSMPHMHFAPPPTASTWAETAKNTEDPNTLLKQAQIAVKDTSMQKTQASVAHGVYTIPTYGPGLVTGPPMNSPILVPGPQTFAQTPKIPDLFAPSSSASEFLPAPSNQGPPTHPSAAQLKISGLSAAHDLLKYMTEVERDELTDETKQWMNTYYTPSNSIFTPVFNNPSSQFPVSPISMSTASTPMTKSQSTTSFNSGQTPHIPPHYMFSHHKHGASTATHHLGHPVPHLHPSIVQPPPPPPAPPLPQLPVPHSSAPVSSLPSPLLSQPPKSGTVDKSTTTVVSQHELDKEIKAVLSRTIPPDLLEADREQELLSWLETAMATIETLKSQIPKNTTTWCELIDKQYELADDASHNNKAGTDFDPASLFSDGDMGMDDDEMMTDLSPDEEDVYFHPGEIPSISKSVEEYEKLWKEFSK